VKHLYIIHPGLQETLHTGAIFFNENSYGGMAYIRQTTNISSNPRKNIRLYRGVTLGSIGPILGCGRENKPSPWEPSVL